MRPQFKTIETKAKWKEDLDEACRKLFDEGYDIIHITPDVSTFFVTGSLRKAEPGKMSSAEVEEIRRGLAAQRGKGNGGA